MEHGVSLPGPEPRAPSSGARGLTIEAAFTSIESPPVGIRARRLVNRLKGRAVVPGRRGAAHLHQNRARPDPETVPRAREAEKGGGVDKVGCSL